MKFYKCPICGNIVTMINDSGVTPHCCGVEMEELNANTVDASLEKHVPVVEIEEQHLSVKVGSVPHPMTPEHHISFIALETTKGFRVNKISDKLEAVTCFPLCKKETPIAVYEYCNLHGLWKVEL
ncbi:MAG: desulfoferrodoxin [Bacilli bacterium]|nr:desulfoferrodoxin [Bacilli bacterium]